MGGIIPPKDVSYLKSIGVDVVFGPGSDTREIVRAITDAVHEKKREDRAARSPAVEGVSAGFRLHQVVAAAIEPIGAAASRCSR